MFRLRPFGTFSEGLDLEADIKLSANELFLRYVVSGSKVGSLKLTQPSKNPTRQDGLWKTTCLELFFVVIRGGATNPTDYYELNFSPSGDWNAYHFDSYRNGMRLEKKIQMTTLESFMHPDAFELHARVNVSELGIGPAKLEASMTAVIETQDNQISYWATHHAGAQADFHLRESFTVNIPSVISQESKG